MVSPQSKRGYYKHERLNQVTRHKTVGRVKSKYDSQKCRNNEEGDGRNAVQKIR